MIGIGKHIYKSFQKISVAVSTVWNDALTWNDSTNWTE